MPITEKAKEYQDKMLQGLQPDLWETDPEFVERFANFAFDEVVNEPGQELEDKTRFLAAQGGCEPQLISHATGSVSAMMRISCCAWFRSACLISVIRET